LSFFEILTSLESLGWGRHDPGMVFRIQRKCPWLLAAAISLALLLRSALTAEDTVPEGTRAMLSKTETELTQLTAALVRSPESVPLLSRRGDCHLFLGRFAEAVADFEKMIALDSTQDAPHWRLGIAYYFAGGFAKAARQFEKYHEYDGGDRENGIWKFLSQARGESLSKARAEMLVYTRFDREPFPALYEMFAGTRTTEDVFREIERKDLTRDDRVMFFANYYAGLNEALLGHRERALELTRKAAASAWGQTAEGGPAYMWQVARIHAARLAAGAE
jgi:lipoprotein NlpI